MSKKTKRSNKGRKGSSVVSPSRKRGRDEVTGLYMQLEEFGRIESDALYGKGSAFIEALNKQVLNETGAYPDFDSTYEFEIDKSRLIITTELTRNSNGDSVTTFQRALLEGSFSFNKGLLESASIESFSGHEIQFRNGERMGEYASITAFTTPRNVADTRRIAPWNYAVGEEDGAVIVMEAQWSLEPTEYGQDAGRVSDIYGQGGGKIFKEGWWQDPFTPNLL